MKITEVMKKLLAIALSLCMLFQYVPVTAFAAAENGLCEHHSVHTDECGYAEGVSDCTYHCDACHTHDEPKTEETVAVPIESESIVVTATAAPEVDLPENDELFAMYAEQKLYGSQWSTLGTAARENLNGVEQAIYDALKTKIETVAASGGSAHFELSNVSGLKTQWTSEELGVDSIEDTAMIGELFNVQFSMGNIIGALLSDCPFDLYWYDKTEGTGMSYGIGRSGQTINGTTYWTEANINDLAFTFEVASGYQGGDNTTVTSGVAKVSTAKTNAQTIVNTYAAKRDYEKLVAYKDEICNLVSYNDEAASNDYTGGYGDPWQLIYVFDGDPTTEVVCEGYSKAFQYLCDLSGLDCISVSGYMMGGTGEGRHMWNIVTLGGANYLVDVTNCDEGTVGAPDALFLVGDPNCSLEEGYSFTIGSQIIRYGYAEDITDTWKESQLMLAAEDYTVPDPTVCTHSWENGTCTLCGEVCSHTGGSASCTAQAVCTVCGSSYGEIRAHSFDSNNICSVCKYGENPVVSIADGDITLSGTTAGVTYYRVGSREGTYTGTITITGSTTNSTKCVTVTSGTHNVILNGLSIDFSTKEYSTAFSLSENAAVTLTLIGENVLKSGTFKAGLEVPVGAALTITAASTGSLNVTGGSNSAAIGGRHGYSSGAIRIEGGTIIATGGEYGAGIGGANGGQGSDIVISGGTVTATGGQNGAGIGGGNCNGFGSNITISGGTVEATGGENGAGIGGGKNGTCGTVTITGGEVTANGGEFASGIGSLGLTSEVSTITIAGGTVTATGGAGSEITAGGGTGIGQRGCIVTISGGTVTATGGYNAGGIVDAILISGGTVIANGGTYRAGICSFHSGNYDDPFTTISGGTVIATGGFYAAGIGGGYNDRASSVFISGGNVLAIGDTENGADDIGSGKNGSGGLVYSGDLNNNAPASLVTITLDGAADGTAVIAAEGIGDYGLKDVVTIEDKLYFYLPDSAAPESVNGEGLLKLADGSYTTNCEHTNTETIPAQLPNCTDTGLTEGTKCADCGTILVAQEEVPKLGHNFGQVKTEPTCTEPGYVTYTCRACYYSTTDNYVPATGHSFGDWTETKAATCTEKGEETRTCHCGEVETNELDALGHTEVIDAGFAATCTKTGLTDGKHCSVCKEVLIAQEVIPTLDHSMQDGYCTICGYGENPVISIANGRISLTEADGVKYCQVGSEEAVPYTGTFTVTGSTTDNYVRVISGTHDVILNGASIDCSAHDIRAAFAIAANATANLTLIGENVLKSGYLEPGLHVPRNATLTIAAESTGSLTATGGHDGAGIGGCNTGSAGMITIAGGTITAISRSGGAGIGSGSYGDFVSGATNYGEIIITGGTVTATGGFGGAGIGGGYNAPNNIITITGGTVTAIGNYGAGIGGGYYGDGGSVTISGGTVTATARYSGAGIGGGKEGDGGSVTITGGNILAIGDTKNGAENIGKGQDGTSSGTLTDSTADVSLVTITIDGAEDGTAVTSAEGIGDYGLTDVVTIGDMLYFYLPASDVPTSVNGKGLVKQPDGSYTTDCKHTSTEIIPAQAPTCSAPGLTEGTKCAVCGKILVEQQVDNSKGDHSFVNGFCVYCDGYQPCEGAGTEASPYLIANAGNLYWFAAQVNGGKDSLCAKLTADIVVNENVLNADGTLNGTPARIWTIIARPNSGGPELYNGIFDGNGHTISGLYFNDFGDNDDIQFVGLFGAVETGSVVKDLGIIDSYFRANTYVGAVVGNSYGTITNCYNKATVSGVDYIGGLTGRNDGVITDCYNAGVIIGEYDAGGVVGSNRGTVKNCRNKGPVSGGVDIGGVAGNSYGQITDCYNTGAIIGDSGSVGGVVGSNGETVKNCRNEGPVSGRYEVGGVVGELKGTVEDCYNTGSVTCTGDGSNIFNRTSGGVVGVNREGATVKNCHNTGAVTGKKYVGGVVGELESGTIVTNCYYLSDSETDSISGTTAKNAEQFASGEVAWMLNSKSDSKVWGQTIDTDAYPGFTGGTVYRNQIAECNGIAAYAYSNTQADPVTGHVPGAAATCTTPQTCTVCGTELAETLGHAFVDGTCTACGEVCSHTGGTASCTEKAKCETCGMEYGELPGHSFTDGFCTVCGVGIACNAATGAAYGTLTEALAAAEAGQTVVMQSDSTENRILILPGVTLDLNGHTLTADYVVGFNTSKICDSSNCVDNGYVAEGLLKVQPDNIVLYEGNGAVPVYNPEKEGFIFVDFLFNSKTAEKDDGTYLNMLVTSRTMEVIDLLKDGAADNDVQVMVRLTWDNETGTAYQDFVFNESTVQNVMSSNNGTFNGFGSMFFVKITGLEALENVTATVMIVSGSNAVDQGKTLNAN